MAYQWKVANNDDILYIVEKVFFNEKCYSMIIFSKTLGKTITIKNLKHDICQWKNFNIYDILYIVEQVLKHAFQW